MPAGERGLKWSEMGAETSGGQNHKIWGTGRGSSRDTGREEEEFKDRLTDEW